MEKTHDDKDAPKLTQTKSLRANAAVPVVEQTHDDKDEPKLTQTKSLRNEPNNDQSEVSVSPARQQSVSRFLRQRSGLREVSRERLCGRISRNEIVSKKQAQATPPLPPRSRYVADTIQLKATSRVMESVDGGSLPNLPPVSSIVTSAELQKKEAALFRHCGASKVRQSDDLNVKATQSSDTLVAYSTDEFTVTSNNIEDRSSIDDIETPTKAYTDLRQNNVNQPQTFVEPEALNGRPRLPDSFKVEQRFRRVPSAISSPTSASTCTSAKSRTSNTAASSYIKPCTTKRQTTKAVPRLSIRCSDNTSSSNCTSPNTSRGQGNQLSTRTALSSPASRPPVATKHPSRQQTPQHLPLSSIVMATRKVSLTNTPRLPCADQRSIQLATDRKQTDDHQAKLCGLNSRRQTIDSTMTSSSIITRTSPAKLIQDVNYGEFVTNVAALKLDTASESAESMPLDSLKVTGSKKILSDLKNESDWEVQCEAMTSIQSYAVFHSDWFYNGQDVNFLTSLSQSIAVLVGHLRSRVSVQALLCVRVLCLCMGLETTDSFLRFVLPVCIKRASDATNAFIAAEADKTLTIMSAVASPIRFANEIVSILLKRTSATTTKLTPHVGVKLKGVECLTVVLSRASKTITKSKQFPQLIQLLAQVSCDSNTDVRASSRICLVFLMRGFSSWGELESVFKRHVSEREVSDLRSASQKLESMKIEIEARIHSKAPMTSRLLDS